MKDGAPAFGWVEKVYRKGDRLLADFAGIPEKLFSAIQDQWYKFVSVELLPNVKADTQVIPWVLDAVALLGATRPAVGILNDLQSLTLRRRPAFQGGARLVFRRDFSYQPEGKSMDESQIKALIDAGVSTAKAEFSRQLDDVKKAADEQVKLARAETAKVQLAAHRDAIKNKFEFAIKADTLEPKFRDQFSRMAGVDDDERVMKVKLEDVDAFIKENSKAPKKFSKKTETGGGDADSEPEFTWAADLVAYRVRKQCFARNIKPADFESRINIADEILRDDPELAKAYRDHAHVPNKAA